MDKQMVRQCLRDRLQRDTTFTFQMLLDLYGSREAIYEALGMDEFPEEYREDAEYVVSPVPLVCHMLRQHTKAIEALTLALERKWK